MNYAIPKTEKDLPKSAKGFDYAYLNDRSKYWKNEGDKWVKWKLELIKTPIKDSEETESETVVNFELPPFMDARFENGVDGSPFASRDEGFDEKTKRQFSRLRHKAADNGHEITLFGY